MDLSVIIGALKAAVLSIASSVGAAFASGLTTIGMGFLAHERTIGANVMAKFHDTYAEAKASGVGEIDAIEQAATASYNEFCHAEVVEFKAEAEAIITLLTSSLKSAAGLK